MFLFLCAFRLLIGRLSCSASCSSVCFVYDDAAAFGCGGDNSVALISAVASKSLSGLAHVGRRGRHAPPSPLHGRRGRRGAGGRQGTPSAPNCVHGIGSRIFRLSGSIVGGKGPGEAAQDAGGVLTRASHAVMECGRFWRRGGPARRINPPFLLGDDLVVFPPKNPD